jgi:thioesterase domain-containing protein
VTRRQVERLQQMLHRDIPLSRAMGVTVEACRPDGVVLAAPIDLNYNHRANAFGGSLATLALLAGYGWVWGLLERHELSATLVVQTSTARYVRPVTRDFTARCAPPPSAAAAAFVTTLQRRRRARILLESTIHEDGALAVTFQGGYVALLD